MRKLLSGRLVLGATALGCLGVVAIAFVMLPRRVLSPDDRLVLAVRKAVQNKIAFSEVEAAVGSKALLNTFTEGDHSALSVIPLGRDESGSETELPYLAKEEDVADIVCWTRPVPADPERLVGIYSDKNGKHHLFFATRLLPG